MNENNQLGKIGESDFKGWCDRAGLVANPSVEDEYGWDYLVEFPPEEPEDKPLDMQPPPIECKIQVKATKQKKEKIKITVSNLNRLIKAQMPTFICIIKYNEKNEAQSLYLIHIWKNIIGRTLERIRKAHVDGSGNKLNKLYITIQYGDDEKVKSINGANLLTAIKNCIPKGIEQYLKEKNGFLNTLGFEDGAAKINCMIIGEENFQDLIDMSLGFDKQVKVEALAGYEKRFEILSKNPTFKLDSAVLSFPNREPHGKATVIFKETEFSPGYSVNAELYITNITKQKEYVKYRFKGFFFDIIFTPFLKKIDFNVSLEYEELFNLSQIRSTLDIIDLLKKFQYGIIIEFESECFSQSPISGTLKNLSGDIHEALSFDDSYSVASAQLSLICQKLKISEEEIFIRFNDLMRCSDNIQAFHSLIFGDLSKIKISFSSSPEVATSKEKVAIVNGLQLKIGGKLIACFISYVGIPKIINQEEYRYELTPEESIVGPILLIQVGTKIENEKIERMKVRFADELQKKGYLPIINEISRN